MIDTELLAQQLRLRGHRVDEIVPVPENAGTWEFRVDGVLLSLLEARALLEADQDLIL